MAPTLEHVFTMRGYMAKTTLDLGAIKAGPHRTVTGLTHGFIKGVPGSRGDGLDVALIPGGSDWILFDPTTNICHLDVRTQATNDAGDNVFVYYHGFLESDQTAADFMGWSSNAKSTKPGQHNWFSAPRIETSSAKFKWVETTMFIGQGSWFAENGEQAVAYDIYAVGN